MTVLAFERYPVADDEARFREALDGLLEHMRESSGVLWADAGKAFDDEPSYIVLSEWRTEADLDAWEQTGDSRSFGDEIDVLLRGDVTRRRFTSP